MKNGILPIVLEEKVVNEIFAAGDCEIEINLKNQKIVLANGEVHGFQIDPYRKECLLKNMDDLDYLLSQMSEIKKFDKKHYE